MTTTFPDLWHADFTVTPSTAARVVLTLFEHDSHVIPVTIYFAVFSAVSEVLHVPSEHSPVLARVGSQVLQSSAAEASDESERSDSDVSV